jgi:hypothetical protein
MFALPDRYSGEAGSQGYFREKHGLTAERIAEALAAL